MMRTTTAAQAPRRLLPAVTAAAVALSLLTGCSAATGHPTATDTPTTTASTTTATPSTSASTSPARSGTITPSPGPSSSPAASASSLSNTTRVDPNAPAEQCKDSALKVSVQYNPEAAGAGQRGAFVVFRNTGTTSCRLQGTPGLSLVGSGNGTQIGEPALRITTGAKLVTLAPGKTALAAIQYTYVDKNGGNYSDGGGHDVACKAKAADGYRVYPPHSYRASFTPTNTYACSTAVHWITVSPVRPASDFQYFTPKA